MPKNKKIIEKRKFEKHVIDLFIDRFHNIFGWKYKLIELRESPDAILETERGKLIGVEICQLFSSQSEARYLLGKEKSFENIMQINDWVEELNKLLLKKDEKFSDYKFDGPIMLLIRSATPDVNSEYLKANEEKMYIPNNYKNVWILLDDQNETDRWTDLVKIK